MIDKTLRTAYRAISDAIVADDRIYYLEAGDMIFATINGFVGYVFRKVDFPFDFSAVKRAFKVENEKIAEVITNPGSLKLLALTPYCRFHNFERDVLRKLSSGDIDVWLNNKYLKQFTSPLVQFFGMGSTDPVYVMQGGVMRGVINPVRVRED